MFRLLFLLLFCLTLPLPAAASWTARLSSHSPEYLLAADKSRKLLFQVETEGSAPAVTRQFECIHGRLEGDKQKEGDLRTPEGVYFITHKITQKLDFMEYGPHAFNLNYPNPADRLRGKTGSGIWLHSKGQPITGLTTRGCMAIDQHELTDLLHLLAPGTPIVIAEHLEGAPFPQTSPLASLPAPSAGGATLSGPTGTDDGAPSLPATPPATDETMPSPLPAGAGMVAAQTPSSAAAASSVPSGDDEKVLRQTLLWMDSRQHNSEDIFNMYDRQNYPRASREKFSSLRKRMRSDFRRQEDLFLDREGIRLLAGPGYWVSCFIKSYQRKGVYHHGLQALYWMPDEGGEFRIIGEVWINN
ncbi:L,D-transpeptidase family protein [uncultured Mailhella sp.]|uniref:L,D-transpeptidase family protein n=1 Tax=uncultured Mailhella sp. TaxID=1981031 RepID=UPI0025DD8B64|nr:L,D-transpeptidase family protein [uncultured Mailhella sp.]